MGRWIGGRTLPSERRATGAGRGSAGDVSGEVLRFERGCHFHEKLEDRHGIHLSYTLVEQTLGNRP